MQMRKIYKPLNLDASEITDEPSCIFLYNHVKNQTRMLMIFSLPNNITIGGQFGKKDELQGTEASVVHY